MSDRPAVMPEDARDASLQLFPHCGAFGLMTPRTLTGEVARHTLGWFCAHGTCRRDPYLMYLSLQVSRNFSSWVGVIRSSWYSTRGWKHRSQMHS